MENRNNDHVIGIPVNSVSYAVEELPVESASPVVPNSPYLHFQQDKKESLKDWMQGIREHVSLGPKISKTVKGKLRLGARILQAGGTERFFRQAFPVSEGEKLVKASQCYLFTTAGPIAGVLFISTKKIAFQSDRSLVFTSPKGDIVRIHYKVTIPVRRMKKTIPSKSSTKPNQKYIQITTVDEFDFWFMGFVSYQKIFKSLQQAVSES